MTDDVPYRPVRTPTVRIQRTRAQGRAQLRLALESPVLGIQNRPLVKRRPDPLTASERDAILADMARHYDIRVVAYFQFQFYSGLRPEEAIALQWGDLDEESGTLRVRRVRTFRGGERDGSKTNSERDVDLVPPSSAALQAMRSYTFDPDAPDRYEKDIFQNPVTGGRGTTSAASEITTGSRHSRDAASGSGAPTRLGTPT
jgi:integrase